MSNPFLDLISSPLMNLDHTYRYSGTKLVEPESLSQHIVDTTMMGLKIIDHINNLSESPVLDPSIYLMKSIYHDMEEVITGDIPRPLKYYNFETTASMKDVADKVAREFFNEEFYDGEKHYKIWDNAKYGKEGFILKVVDTLVVANKVVKEVSLLHNYYMLRVAHEVSSYLKDMLIHVEELSPFREVHINEYICSVIEGSIYTMDKIINDNNYCMRALNICRQSMI